MPTELTDTEIANWAGGRPSNPTTSQGVLMAQEIQRHRVDRALRSITHGLDTDKQVFFYGSEFYVLSNFSAFTLRWRGHRFDTSEAAYHWEKFSDKRPEIQELIRCAPSAHEAFTIAAHWTSYRRSDWDEVRVDVMRDILRAKVEQHPYVRKKLLETGTRELVEDSWRDDFWGWGPNRDGRNMLGTLWMEIRTEIQEKA
jgi:ribA/ribD-fused uncharacterized protein